MAFFNYGDFQDVMDEIRELDAKIIKYTGRMAYPYNTLGYRDYLTPSWLNNTFEQPLKSLGERLKPPYTYEVRTWQAYEPFSRADYDHWKLALAKMDDVLSGEIQFQLRCGAFRAATIGRNYQVLQRGN